MFLNKICNLFQTNQSPCALVGGYTVALHGAVRGSVGPEDVKALRSLQ